MNGIGPPTFLPQLLQAGKDGLPLAFKLISPLFILVACGLAGGAVYQWFDLIMPMYGPPNTAFFFISTGFGVFIVSQILLNYYRCITVSPGNPGYVGCKEVPLHNVDRDDDYYCKHCKFVTGKDTQHCFICGKCVSDLDHHCPWIMNCVGRENHKYFFLFLFYVTIGCLYLASFSVLPFYTITYRHKRFSKFQPRHIDSGMLSLCAVLPLTLTLAVGGMMLWHLYLLGTAQTSPEFAFNCQAKMRAYKQGKRWINKKDLGFVKNWKKRFGLENNNFWYILWLFPYLYKPKVNEYNKISVDDDMNVVELGLRNNNNNKIGGNINENIQIQQRTPNSSTTIHHV